uniref:Uncharacterized protein n=1 Tax=Tanacetum cinerariifolium TaxID=118510 RepID=A0A6L2K7I1_TANCI|nr:hypothetical protein [Tanacetum cinerariifolium]
MYKSCELQCRRAGPVFSEGAHVNNIQNTQAVYNELPDLASLCLKTERPFLQRCGALPQQLQIDDDPRLHVAMKNEPVQLTVKDPSRFMTTKATMISNVTRRFSELLPGISHLFIDVKSYHLLNSEDHANFLKKNNRNPAE